MEEILKRKKRFFEEVFEGTDNENVFISKLTGNEQGLID